MCVKGKSYLKKGLPDARERIRDESYSKYETFIDVHLV